MGAFGKNQCFSLIQESFCTHALSPARVVAYNTFRSDLHTGSSRAATLFASMTSKRDGYAVRYSRALRTTCKSAGNDRLLFQGTVDTLELPCLPFTADEVFIPTSTKTLHLYEARYLALLDDVLAVTGGLFGHVVLEPVASSAADKNSTSFVASHGCLVMVENVRRLSVGALVSIRGVARIRLLQVSQLEPFLRCQVAVVRDLEGPYDKSKEVKELAADLLGILKDVQALQIKLRTSSDVSLQTPLMCALRWVDSPTLPSLSPPPGPPQAQSQRDTSDPYAWLTSTTDDFMARNRGPSDEAGNRGSGSGSGSSSSSSSSSSILGGSREAASKAGAAEGRAGSTVGDAAECSGDERKREPRVANEGSDTGIVEEGEANAAETRPCSGEAQLLKEGDGGARKAGEEGNDKVKGAMSGRQEDWNEPQVEKKVMQLTPGDLRCLLPASTELLSFAGLQPAAGLSPRESHELLQMRLKAMELMDTEERLQLVRDFSYKSRAVLAAKLALQGLSNSM